MGPNFSAKYPTAGAPVTCFGKFGLKPALEVGVLKKKIKFGEVKQRTRPMLCTKVDIYISQKLTPICGKRSVQRKNLKMIKTNSITLFTDITKKTK